MTAFILCFSTVSLSAQEQVASQALPESADTILKDPTQPLGYKAKSTKKRVKRPALPVLQSVVVNENRKRAIMNSKFYEVGQKINGYRLKRIDKEAVWLHYAGKSYRVSLYSNQEKFSQ